MRSRAAATYSSSRSLRDGGAHRRAMIGVKTIPMTRMTVAFDGPSATSARSRHDDDRDREERLHDAHEHVVHDAAEVAGDQAERGAADRAEQRRRRRDGEDVARADDDAREHVAPELVRAEPVVADGGLEARRRIAGPSGS